MNVLFLSTGNAARGLMAEALLAHRSAGWFKAFSAGSFPLEEPDRHAIELLERTRLPTANLRCKGWDEFARPGAPEMDFVFTLCDAAAEQVCPVWPGQPVTGHWSVPDPAAVEGTELERVDAYREALRVLERRIELFVLLPHESLDRISLAHHVGDIGKQH
jgi:arsenate reductase (thioredoxin)